MKLNRKGVLSNSNQIANIKQKSGKHEVYSKLELFDENDYIKAELLPNVSISGDYDSINVLDAIKQLFLTVIKKEDFLQAFLDIWKDNLIYDSGGELVVDSTGELVWEV